MTTETNALAVPPTLEDPETLAELLATTTGDFLRALQMPDSSESAERISNLLFGLAGVFSEESGIVGLPKGWTLAKAGARLRTDSLMAERLAELTEEDRALFDEDDQVIVLAIQMFFEGMRNCAAEWCARAGVTTLDDEALHRFLSDPVVHLELLEWGHWLLGNAPETPDEAKEGGE